METFDYIAQVRNNANGEEYKIADSVDAPNMDAAIESLVANLEFNNLHVIWFSVES